MLNFGLLLPFRNPTEWKRSFADIYSEHIDSAAYAEEIGYDTIWTTEHHFCEDGWSPSLLPILSAIAARTKTIRIGTFVIVLPYHHPVRVAEDAATVDIISNGRLDLGFGQGYWLSEFASFNISRKQRVSRLTEGIEIIEKCFTEKNFSYDGKYWKLNDIELNPRPIQRPKPPIWVAAQAENSARRVARLGYHLSGTGGVDLQQYYDSELNKLGQSFDDHQISQCRAVYLAESREKAWDDCEKHLHYMMSMYDKRYKEADDMKAGAQIMSAPMIPPIGKLRNDKSVSFFGAPLIIGTPDDAIAEIERYQKTSRVTHLVMWMHMAGMPIKKIRNSMSLFATEVMPLFRDN